MDRFKVGDRVVSLKESESGKTLRILMLHNNDTNNGRYYRVALEEDGPETNRYWGEFDKNLAPVETPLGFKVGDEVTIDHDILSFHCALNKGTIAEVHSGGKYSISDSSGTVHDECGIFPERALALVNNNEFETAKVESINKSGETKVNNNEQEFEFPAYVIIVKNTEMFKKGGVFYKSGSYYEQQTNAYHVTQYSTTLRKEQVQLLIEKKVAVEAVKFNPEFVTLAQDEVLHNALANANKPAKKAVAKKVTPKKASK